MDADCVNQLKSREKELSQLFRTGQIDSFAEGSWQLVKDYPKEISGYLRLIMAITAYESRGTFPPEKSPALAKELIASSAPKNCKDWAQGFLNRKDSSNEPLDLKFTALDGRLVDLKQMRGKVVLVVFWDTSCGACEKELPYLKAAWDKFHNRGLEIVGISGDSDKTELEKFVQNHEIPWPQFFDGTLWINNKFIAAFGIGGFPHMFFVNRNGLFCYDRVRASNGQFEKIISMLLTK